MNIISKNSKKWTEKWSIKLKRTWKTPEWIIRTLK
jgi:hypothetical protein